MCYLMPVRVLAQNSVNINGKEEETEREENGSHFPKRWGSRPGWDLQYLG